MYLCTRFWFRSSVGLEQQPSKLWVLGSNPNGITKKGGLVITTSPPFFFYISIYPFPMQLVTPSVAPIAVSNEIKTLSTSFQFSFDIDILSV